MEQNPAPGTPEENNEEDEGRRVLSEAIEEDATLTPSDIQTAHFIRFSNRRPQRCHIQQPNSNTRTPMAQKMAPLRCRRLSIFQTLKSTEDRWFGCGWIGGYGVYPSRGEMIY